MTKAVEGASTFFQEQIIFGLEAELVLDFFLCNCQNYFARFLVVNARQQIDISPE